MTRRHALALAALAGALGAVLIAWLAVDRRPPEWDYANHLERAVLCHRTLTEPGHSRLAEVIAESSFYPPVVTCAAGLLYLVFPVTPLTAQSVIWAFLVIGLLAIYGVGRRLVDGPTGLLAAFLFATAPFVVTSLLSFQLDLPLAAMVALALYALVRAEAFSRWDWSLVAGVVLGFGMLTKPPFAAYMTGPVAWAGWAAVSAPDRGARMRRLAAALAVGVLIALPWYGPRLAALPMQILNRSFRQAAESGHAPALSATGFLFYPRLLVPQFGLLAALLLGWGIFAMRRLPGARVLLWSALAPFLIFLLIQNKNLRYTLPILPAVALVTAVGVLSLGRSWRRGVIWACLAVGALQVSMTAFALPRPLVLPLFLTPLPISFPPSPADWQEDRVLDDLVRASRGRPATVAVVPNYNFFSVSNFRYEALRRGLPLQMTRAWNGPPLGIDFVILKTGSQGPSFTVEKAERLTRGFAEDRYLDAVFPVIKEYPLPDGSHGILRARRIPPLRDLAPAELASRLQQAHEAALADYVRDAVGLRVSVSYRPEAILQGEVDRVRVEAEAATVGELKRRDRAPLRVRDARIDVEQLLINPRRLAETGALEILDAAALRIHALAITQADLDAFLQGQPAGALLTVRLGEGAALVRLKRVPGGARVGMRAQGTDAPFSLEVEDLRVGGIPVPGLLVDWLVRHFDPTPRLRNLPVPVSLGTIRIHPGRVEVGDARGGAAVLPLVARERQRYRMTPESGTIWAPIQTD